MSDAKRGRKPNPPRCYGVLSPQYVERERVLDDGSGPDYPANDFLLVFTRTARRAKVLALRAWRRRNKLDRYFSIRDRAYLDRSENPFKGMRVTLPAEIDQEADDDSRL